MKAIITSYRYCPAGEAHISTGHKGHSRPKNAFRGGNGTFLVLLSFGIAKIQQTGNSVCCIFYQTEDGQRGVVNMYGTIKFNSTRRITANYVDTLMTSVVGQTVHTEHIYDDILQFMAHHIE